MSNSKNYVKNDTVVFTQNTQLKDQTPVDFTGTLQVYKSGTATPDTAGVSFLKHNSTLGLIQITVVTTTAFYVEGQEYNVVGLTGTIDGDSVLGKTFGRFSLGSSEVDVIELGGDAQSLADLKDFADEGYDPATNTSQATVVAATAAFIEDLFTVDSTLESGDEVVGSLVLEVAKVVWDRILQGSTHNINNSSGKRLRVLSGVIFSEGVAQGGSNNTIQLASGAITFDTQFEGSRVILIEGTGELQEAIITGSTASNDTLIITPAWTGANPVSGTGYIVIPAQVHATVRNGGYDNSSVYFKTGGNTGTQKGVAGTSTNPSGDEANTYTIMAQENIDTLVLRPASSFVMPSDSSGKTFVGSNTLLDFSGEDISGSLFSGVVNLTGTALTAGVPSFFSLSGFASPTMPPFGANQCSFSGTITLSAAGGTNIGGSAGIAGTTPTFILPNTASASTMCLLDWRGDVSVKNMGLGGSADIVEVTGAGRLILDNTSTSGVVNLYAPATIDLGASTGITVNRFQTGVDWANVTNQSATVNLTGTLSNANLVEIVSGTITQSSTDRIVDNWNLFWDNGDAQTGKTVNDVGASFLVGPTSFFSVSRTLTNSTETGTHLDTHTREAGTIWEISPTLQNGGEFATIDYTMDPITARAKFVTIDLGLDAGGQRNIQFQVEDQTSPGTYDSLGQIGNTNGNLTTFDIPLEDRHTDISNGLVRFRLFSTSINTADDILVNYIAAVAETETGTIPSATENAIAVEALLSSNHGDGNWEGDVVLETFVASVVSQTEFTLSTGPSKDDIFRGFSVAIRSDATPADIDSGYITDYTGSTLTVKLFEPMDFTIAVGDDVSITAVAPVVLAGFATSGDPVALTDTYGTNATTFFGNDDNLTAKLVDDVGVNDGDGSIVHADYLWDTNTAATNPGGGDFKGDNADQSLITNFYVSGVTANGVDIKELIGFLKSGDEYRVTLSANSDVFIQGVLTGDAVSNDSGAWWTLPVSVTSDGGALTNGQSIVSAFRFGTSVAGTIDANIVEVLGTAVTETNAGDIAASWSFFYDVNPVTTKTVNDVGVAGSGLTQQNVRDAMYLTPSAGTPDTDSIDEKLDDLEGGTGGGSCGSGSIAQLFIIEDDDDVPIADCKVWITTDAENLNKVAGVQNTNDFGEITFFLNAGDYYLWRDKTGTNFLSNPNPVAIEVTEPTTTTT